MWGIFALLTALFLGAVNAAQAQTVTPRDFLFEVRANGFRYGDFLVSLRETGKTYSVDVSAQATGIFGFLLRARYSGTSTGEIGADGTRKGVVFWASSSRIFANRTQRVTYLKGRPQTVSILPLKRRTTLSDPTEIAGNFNDPLSFLANLVANPGTTCLPPADLYDGRRITRVMLTPAPSKPGTLICSGSYKIIEGPDHSLQRGVRQFTVRATYDRVPVIGLKLERVDFESNGNIITLNRLGN